jgi:hypothetical protein
MTDIVLLGPQRLRPTLAGALDELGIDGPIATVTCGWQEAEDEEAEELGAGLDRPIIKLLLHQRSDDIFQRDPEFFEAYRGRQNELHQLQELYRLRLKHTLEAARELMRRVKGSDHILEPEREAALEAVRTLDSHHLERLREVHEKFKANWNPDDREVIAEHRAELAAELETASALVVAGGHVAVLLYRLRLLDMTKLIENTPVVAWSAGAMALAERVVLFHDSPPQGQGNPELLEAGLGLAKGVLPFPHARRRLRVEDPVRVASLARRFAPNACVAMDEGAQLHYRNSQWSAREGTLRLSSSGKLVEFTQ